MATKKKTPGKMVLITTERRGVFVGKLESYDEAKRVAVLKDARMAIRWGTTRGLLQLCQTGPTSNSNISDKAPRILLEVCECVVEMTKEAEAAWKRLG